jgi:hypothetical protein
MFLITFPLQGKITATAAQSLSKGGWFHESSQIIFDI